MYPQEKVFFRNITYEENLTQNISSEDKNSVLEKFVKKIPGFPDVNAQDVDEWLIADDPEFNTNDDKIVQSVFHDFNSILSLEEIEEPVW